MYKMCELILEAAPEVDFANYSLPNKHYFEIGQYFSTGVCIVLKTRWLTVCHRSELAQGYQEHGQGRRSLRPAVWTQRLDQVRGFTIIDDILGSDGQMAGALAFYLRNFRTGRAWRIPSTVQKECVALPLYKTLCFESAQAYISCLLMFCEDAIRQDPRDMSKGARVLGSTQDVTDINHKTYRHQGL